MKSKGRLSVLGLLLVAFGARGEELSTQAGNVSTATVPTIAVAVDLRPSWALEKQSFHSENEASVRFALSPATSIAWVQEFHTNVSNPTAPGLDFRLADGYLRTDVENFWADDRRGLSLSYQARLYLPTARDVRAPGFAAELRNGFRFGWAFAPGWSVAVKEIPVVPLFTRAASVVDGELVANAWFENRMELELSVDILPKLNLKIPLVWQAFRNRAAGGAKDSDSWKQSLWIYPELVYAVGAKTGLGLGYYSANFIDGDGFRKGVPQLILQQSI